MVRAIAEEAAAIHRDYRGIIEGNYPDLRDARLICRIEREQLDLHIALASTFDERAVVLQKSFAANAAMIAEVRDALRDVNLSSQTDAGALMTSILAEIGGVIAQAAARQHYAYAVKGADDFIKTARAYLDGARRLLESTTALADKSRNIVAPNIPSQ